MRQQQQELLVPSRVLASGPRERRRKHRARLPQAHRTTPMNVAASRLLLSSCPSLHISAPIDSLAAWVVRDTV